jgi:hypothetical protein
MSSIDLIEKLSARPEPVRIASPQRAALLWGIVSLMLVMAALLSGLGVRADLFLATQRYSFMLSLISLLWTVALGSVLCFESGLPGVQTSRASKIALGISFAVLILSYGLESSVHRVGTAPSFSAGLSATGFSCSGILLLLSFLPGLGLWVWMRSLAPVSGSRTAGWMGLTLGAMGALGVSVHCSSAQPLHLMVYHALPILGLAVLLTGISNRLLRW